MSKRSLIPLALAGVTMLAVPAFAATQTKSGDIKSTDASKHELVLSSGETFELAPNVKVDQLKVGEKVVVSYEAKNGKMIASKVHLAK
ncbi:MAG: DUF1344 domain-containing protein [Hyphomicrobium sp.]